MLIKSKCDIKRINLAQSLLPLDYNLFLCALSLLSQNILDRSKYIFIQAHEDVDLKMRFPTQFDETMYSFFERT